ncbi:MAG: Grx4 family monothiol glutaredoxin [Oligoflexia bacterium]|nr:Grx4 family monothiol glutaredoxin [Oligoflexia bacterium]
MSFYMTVKEQITNLVSKHPIMLFMKGIPAQPQCGFSARVVQILDFLKVKYHSFDVLSNENIRQGIKEYGNWPTIPQLYVNKELLGGCDIVQEMFQSGELEKSLSSFIEKSTK